MGAFHVFSKASGLEASIEKSCIYCAGVTQNEAKALANSIHMHIEELPFNYLGVPLAARKLNFS